jgi:hypothetical protein
VHVVAVPFVVQRKDWKEPTLPPGPICASPSDNHSIIAASNTPPSASALNKFRFMSYCLLRNF